MSLSAWLEACNLKLLGQKQLNSYPAGDFNLLLLDQLLAEPKLNMINTCNELSKPSCQWLT